MNTLLSVLHVVAAVFIIGPMAILPMTAMRALRAGEGGQVATLARSTFVFSLASLVVALLGFGLVSTLPKRYNVDFTTPWLLISIICYVVAFVLNLVAVVPALRSAADHLLDPQGHALRSADYRRIGIASGVVSLLLVVITVLMVWRP